MSFKFEQEEDNVVRMSVIKGECVYSALLDETSFSSAYVELDDIEKCFTGDQNIDQHTSADYSIFERPDGSSLDVSLCVRYSKSQKLKSVCENFSFTLTRIERDLQLAEIVRLTKENETMAKKIRLLETDDIPTLKQENENLRQWIDYLKTYQIGYFDISKFRQPVPNGIVENSTYNSVEYYQYCKLFYEHKACSNLKKITISLKFYVGNSPIIEDPVIRYVFEHDRFKKYIDFFKKVDDFLSFDVTSDYSYSAPVADAEFAKMGHEEKTKYFINYETSGSLHSILFYSPSRFKHLLFHAYSTNYEHRQFFIAENFQNIYQNVPKLCQRQMEVMSTYYDLHTEYLLRGKVMLPPTLFGSKFYMIDHPSGDPETVTHEFDTLSKLLNPPHASDRFFLNPNIGFYQTPDEFI
jgi:hypothetical protein